MSVERKAMGKGRYSYKYKCVWKYFDIHFSVTVERNRIKVGNIIAPLSGSLHPKLGLRSSYRFGVMNTFARPIQNVHVR